MAKLYRLRCYETGCTYSSTSGVSLAMHRRNRHQPESDAAFNQRWAEYKNEYADREREQEARAFLNDPF